MMRTLDRYIIGKTLWPLGTAIGIAMLALLLERMVRLLDLVVAEGGPLYLIVKMLANLIPHYLGIALPAAFFVGVLLAAMRLSGDNELEAIHAFGVGLHRVLAPILGLAVVLVLASTLIIGFLQPYTRYAYRALVYVLTNTAWDAAIERGAFFTGFGSMTITVNDISAGGTRLSGIFVHEEKPDGGSITTSAAEGRMLRDPENLRLILSMEEGVRIESSGTDRQATGPTAPAPIMMPPAKAGRTTVLTFRHFELPLDLDMAPEPFRPRGEGSSEMSLFELWQARWNPPPDTNVRRIVTEFHARVVRIVSLLLLPLIAVPLGMAARRTNRGVGFAAGLGLVVLYHYVLQFGESLAAVGRTSVWVGLWLPFVCFAAISLLGFSVANTRPGENPIAAVLETLQQKLDGVRQALVRRRRPA